MRPFNVVVYGATGYTGRLVTRYLTNQRATVAVAGRDAHRLRSAAPTLPFLVADSDDEHALRSLAEKADVVVSAAGPYTPNGSHLVAACIDAGTDYIDINGEVPWMKSVVERFDEPAARRGVKVVLSCGFCAPSDLGVLFALASVPLDQRGRVENVLHFHGRLSGGTVATGLMLDEAPEAVQRVRRDPFALCSRPPPEDECCELDADPRTPVRNARLNEWCAPFWMSAISSRVVRRSAELFRQAGEFDAATRVEGVGTGNGDAALPQSPLAASAVEKLVHRGGGYGPGFGYREMAWAADEGAAQNAAESFETSVERRKRLLARGKLPAVGEGPSEEARAASWFRSYFCTPEALFSVSGGDPGYEETSKIVSEAALLLARHRDALPNFQRSALGAGGVLTPAFAFGAPLVQRLHEVGVCFEQLDEGRRRQLVRDGHGPTRVHRNGFV